MQYFKTDESIGKINFLNDRIFSAYRNQEKDLTGYLLINPFTEELIFYKHPEIDIDYFLRHQKYWKSAHSFGEYEIGIVSQLFKNIEEYCEINKVKESQIIDENQLLKKNYTKINLNHDDKALMFIISEIMEHVLDQILGFVRQQDLKIYYLAHTDTGKIEDISVFFKINSTNLALLLSYFEKMRLIDKNIIFEKEIDLASSRYEYKKAPTWSIFTVSRNMLIHLLQDFDEFMEYIELRLLDILIKTMKGNS